MKTISLTKQQIIESIILLLGSEKTRPDLVNKITGVYNFKGINEGTKLRIDRIVKSLNKEEIEFNKREVKTIKEFYIENNKLSKEEIDEILNEEYKGEKISDFIKEIQSSDKLKELNDRIIEIDNTSIEIQIEPISLSKIEDLISDDGVSYVFIYDNFAE